MILKQTEHNSKWQRYKNREQYDILYMCEWCKNRFNRIVGKTYGSTDVISKKEARAYSSQVQCPYCKNFIKTWD